MRSRGNQDVVGSYDKECRGKVCFTSRKQAKGVLRVMRTRANMSERLNVYKCSTCGYRHIGNQPRGR